MLETQSDMPATTCSSETSDNKTPKEPDTYTYECLAKLHVDIHTGKIFSRGKEIGFTNPSNGYVFIAAGKRRLKRYHIVWWKATGKWPNQLVDHKDRSKDNDWFDNLALSTSHLNGLNSKRKPRLLPRGVTEGGSSINPYRAQIAINGRMTYIGHYSTPEIAGKAWLVRYQEIHGCLPPQE